MFNGTAPMKRLPACERMLVVKSRWLLASESTRCSNGLIPSNARVSQLSTSAGEVQSLQFLFGDVLEMQRQRTEKYVSLSVSKPGPPNTIRFNPVVMGIYEIHVSGVD